MTRKTAAKQTKEMPKCDAITGGVCGYFTAHAPIPDCRTSVNSVSGMSTFSSGKRRRSGKAVTDSPRMSRPSTPVTSRWEYSTIVSKAYSR